MCHVTGFVSANAYFSMADIFRKVTYRHSAQDKKNRTDLYFEIQNYLAINPHGEYFSLLASQIIKQNLR